jgi:hypothetical protein
MTKWTEKFAWNSVLPQRYCSKVLLTFRLIKNSSEPETSRGAFQLKIRLGYLCALQFH